MARGRKSPVADPVATGEKVIWTPQPGPQTAFALCPYREAFYGGAAGGGKSDALIGDFAAGIEVYGSAWHGLIARRSFPQMVEIEKRCYEIFSPHYGPNSYKKSERTWYFKTANGLSTFKLASIDDYVRALDHQGQQYSWIGFDELTQWPDDECFEYLLTRMRSPKGSPTYIRAAGNPGGVGHDWVKKRYRIDEHPAMTPFEVQDSKGRTYQRVFIPAKLRDNLILMKNDPMYESVLDSIADPVLRRALKDGDWSVAAGAAFPEFNPDTHVRAAPEVGRGQRVWRACDWGFEKPYAVLWFWCGMDGTVWVLRELYGGSALKSNQGLRHSPETVWNKIQQIEKSMGWDVKEAYLDPQCWMQDGGRTIYDELGGAKMHWQPWPKGPGSRVIQKQVVHQYLMTRNGKPTLLIDPSCRNLIRVLGQIPLSRKNREDVDSDAEDHVYDALRGGLARMQPDMRKAFQQNNFLMSLDDLDGGDMQRHPVRKNRFGGW